VERWDYLIEVGVEVGAKKILSNLTPKVGFLMLKLDFKKNLSKI